GSSGGSGASPSETEELRRYLRGEAESRALSLATNSFEAAGQRYLDERFRVYSSLLWTEENRFSGSLSFVVPLRERGRSVTFLQPGLIAWNGSDVEGKRDRRTDYSFGVVHRVRTGEGRFFGGSLFYDRGRYDHQRVGLGVDYQVVRTRLSGNLYYPLSDSELGFADAREHALRGLDATVEQGISDRFSASFTGGLWEVSGAGSEKIGDSKSTFSGDFRYHLSDILTFRGGYEWSDDFINTADSYRVGVDIRFPAGAGSGRSTGFRSDPWAPVKRESRILVARGAGGIATRTLPGGALRTLLSVTESGGGVGAVVRPVGGSAAATAAVEVVLSDGAAVYYGIDWNAGTATFGAAVAADNDFEVVSISDKDSTVPGSSLFVDESQNCILVPAGVTTLDIGLSILPRDNENAEIIRVRLTPAGDLGSCLAAAVSGVTQAVASVDISALGVLDISIPLAPSTTGGSYGVYVSVQALDVSNAIPASIDNTVTLTDTTEAEKVRRFRVYISAADTDAAAPGLGALTGSDVVETVVQFTGAAAIFGESYEVEVVGGASTAAVTAGLDGRYLVSFRGGALHADFAVSLASGARIFGVGSEAVVGMVLESGVSGSATVVPGIGGTPRDKATITLDPTPRIAFGDDAGVATAYRLDNPASESGGVLRVPVTVSYLPSAETTFAVVVNSGGGDTAAEATDYTFTDKAVIFAPTADAGDDALTKYLEITLTDDAIFEDDEAFTLTFAAADAVPDLGDLYARSNTADLAITDDQPRPKLTIAATGLSLTEAGGDIDSLRVELTGLHSEVVSGSLTLTAGTGVGGATSADYTFTNPTPFTIGAGSLSVDVPITVIDDTIDELDETFTAVISTTDLDVDGVLNTTALVTITDDDPIPSLVVLSPTLTTSEGRDAEIGVVLSGESSRDVVVSWTVSLGTASPADFVGYSASGRITILAGATSGTISLPTLRDSVAERALRQLG
ncbi:MAG: inverse autotransporter beta domain-containing protein, partial [Alphaproteobacteria bacterium]